MDKSFIIFQQSVSSRMWFLFHSGCSLLQHKHSCHDLCLECLWQKPTAWPIRCAMPPCSWPTFILNQFDHLLTTLVPNTVRVATFTASGGKEYVVSTIVIESQTSGPLPELYSFPNAAGWWLRHVFKNIIYNSISPEVISGSTQWFIAAVLQWVKEFFWELKISPSKKTISSSSASFLAWYAIRHRNNVKLRTYKGKAWFNGTIEQKFLTSVVMSVSKTARGMSPNWKQLIDSAASGAEYDSLYQSLSLSCLTL